MRKIYKHLCNIYGSATVDRSTVSHWEKSVTTSETGIAQLHHLPCSGLPVIAVCLEMLQHAFGIVCED